MLSFSGKLISPFIKTSYEITASSVPGDKEALGCNPVVGPTPL
jgi:hypothetical protein